jgi:hypothetical protein
MASGRSLLRLAPEEADEETVVVSKKKLDRLLKESTFAQFDPRS